MTAVGDSPSAPSAVTPTPAPKAVVSVSMEQVENPLCISGADSSTEEASSPFSLTSFSSNSTPSDRNKTNEAVIIVSSPERDTCLSTQPTSFCCRLKRENLSYLQPNEADTVKTLGSECARPYSDREQAARRKLVARGDRPCTMDGQETASFASLGACFSDIYGFKLYDHQE